MTLSHQHRLLILFTITVVASAAVVLYVVEPLRTSIRTIGNEILEQQATLELRKSAAVGSGQRLDETTHAEAALSELQRVYVQRADALSFITLLEELAHEKNIELTLALPDVQPADDVQEVALNLSLVGTFEALVSTLEDIEHLGPYFNIPALTFVPNTRTTEGTTVRLTFSAVTYWQ